ncbi:MAG: hypothetical protein JO217_08310 [Acidobacteriaceae bacterium]|nr:hypothetical protein [Acidobacteriaceae bacterium]MBV9442682.1 hypothetical protein [Acidobacteriaceae bacterium]
MNEAIETTRSLLEKVLAWGAKPESNLEDAVQVSRLHAALANLFRRTHQRALAAEVEAQQTELWQHWNNRLPCNRFVAHQLNAGYRRR